jgi:hypothetical protein
MASVNWFVNVFLVSMASAILLLGVVADWLGKELMFVIGAAIFMSTAFFGSKYGRLHMAPTLEVRARFGSSNDFRDCYCNTCQPISERNGPRCWDKHVNTISQRILKCFTK